MKWTYEADTLLIKLWNAGGSLASVTDALRGEGYTVSRNMIAGRKHRLPKEWFLKRPRVQTAGPRPRQRSKPTVNIRQSFKDHLPLPTPEPEDGVEYLERSSDGCRAILDKRGGDWNLSMVCGRTQTFNANGNQSSYCEKHLKLYTQYSQRRG